MSDNTLTVRTIVRQRLIADGFDGLYDAGGECGCENDDLMPCCGVWSGSGNVPACQPVYRTACDCGDLDWHMSPTREENPAYHAQAKPTPEAVSIAMTMLTAPWQPGPYVFAYSAQDRIAHNWRPGDKIISGPGGLELHLSATWPGQ